MALLPSMPTSFVPREASSAPRPHVSEDSVGIFGALMYILFGITILISIGVFFYARVLTATQASDEIALTKAAQAIDPATLEGFVRLRDRLTSSQTLLKNHVAFSNFFASLGTILPQTVRFMQLHMIVDDTGTGKVEGAGVAKSFNALSAASAAFATDGRIKDVIFSKININQNDSTVSFGFSATLDPRILQFSPSSYAATGSAVPASSTTL